jgi:FkbM family methyltransferase
METSTEITKMLLPGRRSWAVPNVPDARQVWQEIFEDEAYRDAAMALREGDVILDVGAHTGLSTLYFSERVAGLRIEAFEPAPVTYKCLMRNLAAHVPDAIGYPYALGEAEGEVEFTYYPATPSQSGRYASREADDRVTMDYLLQVGVDREDAESLIVGLHEGKVMTVPMHTVSKVIADGGLDRVALLKIDVERAELDVLAGISDADWPRIEAVIAEVHDLGDRLDTVRQLLAGHAFSVTAKQERGLVGGEMWTVHAVR